MTRGNEKVLKRGFQSSKGAGREGGRALKTN